MSLFEFIGIVVSVLAVMKVVYNLWHFTYTTWLGAALGKNIDVRKYGPWAVVTGATSGIGKAYAFNLASKGLNVVLVSRNPEKLEKVSKEIKQKYAAVETKTIAVDFTDGDSIYEKLKSELEDTEVGILVNNVGTGTPIGPFGSSRDHDKLYHDMVNCNAMSMVRTTALILPGMIERKKGVIINIGSVASVLPLPNKLILYGATKAFVAKFSWELAFEWEKHGIVVQGVHPCYVFTAMTEHDIESKYWSAALPDEYVEAQLRTLGLEKSTAAFWIHKIQFYFYELAFFFFPELLTGWSMTRPGIPL